MIPDDDTSPFPSNRLRKGEATRAAILSAAAQRFAEDGYADCSLRDIAKAAGLQAGSVYYHFESKEDLLNEVLRVGVQTLHRSVSTALAALPAGSGVRERLRCAIRIHVGSFLDAGNPAHAYLRVSEHLPPSMKRRLRASRRDYARLWQDMLADGRQLGAFRQDLDPTTLVSYLLQSLNGIVEWYSPATASVATICDLVHEVLLGGIAIANKDAIRQPPDA